MPPVPGQLKSPENGNLNLEEAAAHVEFTVDDFEKWVQLGLFPASSWTKGNLDKRLDDLRRNGWPSHRELPDVQRQLRRNGLGVKRIHHYRRGVRGPLEGEPGSGRYMSSLIEKNRQWVAHQSRSHAPQPIMTAEPPDQDQTEPSATAQASKKSPPIAPKLLTRNSARERVDADKELQSTVINEFLTETEVVERYRNTITAGTLRNWRSAKTGPPFVRIGRAIFYPRALLLLWENSNTLLCDLATAANRIAETVG